MNLEMITGGINRTLRHAFKTVKVVPVELDLKYCRAHMVEGWEKFDLKAVAIFLNGNQRWVMFYINDPEKGACFTRPKQGVVKDLIYHLRIDDCRFRLDGDVNHHSHVLARFMDSHINAKASKDLERVIEQAMYSATEKWDCATGFRVVSGDRPSLSYEIEFELHFKRKDEDEFKQAVGFMTDGRITRLITMWNSANSNLTDIFY